MGPEFWRTIRMAIKQDNWTARLVIVLCMTPVTGFGAFTIVAGK